MQEHSNYWLRRRISRRTALRGSALTVAGASTMALVGCGDDDDDSGGGNTNGGGQVLLPTAAACLLMQSMACSKSPSRSQ